ECPHRTGKSNGEIGETEWVGFRIPCGLWIVKGVVWIEHRQDGVGVRTLRVGGHAPVPAVGGSREPDHRGAEGEAENAIAELSRCGRGKRVPVGKGGEVETLERG